MLALVICASSLWVAHAHAIYFPVFNEPCQVLGVNINGTTCNQTDIGGFVQQIYSFAVGVVGLLIFVRLIQAGFYYFGSAVGATENKGANMVKDALIGAFILFSSYLILNIINPDLVHTNLFNLRKVSQLIDKNQFRNIEARQSRADKIKTLSDADARAAFTKAGIGVKKGVSLEGVEVATVNAVIDIYRACNKAGENCDGWAIARGTNFTGGNYTDSAFAGGSVLGVDADNDLEDYFESNPDYVLTNNWKFGDQKKWQNTNTKVEAWGYNINDYEIFVP